MSVDFGQDNISEETLPTTVQVFKPRRGITTVLMLTAMSFLTLFGIEMVLSSAGDMVRIGTGAACIIGPGGFAVMVMVREYIGKPELRLCPDWFELTSFGNTTRYYWTDLDKPFRHQNSGSRFADSGIQFSLKEPRTMQQKIDKKLSGYSNTLPEYFDSGNLLNKMNEYWTSADIDRIADRYRRP